MESPNRAIVTELVPRGSLWDALRTHQLFQVININILYVYSINYMHYHINILLIITSYIIQIYV